MKVQWIKCQDLDNLTGNSLKTLTLPDGMMSGMLSACRRYNSRPAGMVGIIRNEKRIIGWALVFGYKPLDHRLYMFIHKNFRRMGYGEQLFKSAKRKFKKLNVYPHDTVAQAFYRNLVPSKVIPLSYYGVSV